MLIRNKLALLSLLLVLLGTGCSDEIKKKDPVSNETPPDACAHEEGDDRYFCLQAALQIAAGQSCSAAPDSATCGKEKFLHEGYGGFVYPQPVMSFLNGIYDRYVRYYHGRYGVLPESRHFGELFGLIYNDDRKAATPDDIDVNMLPVGIVAGGTTTSGTQYLSESCALCHFNLASDGFYRFGVPNTSLKYGGLKLAFNRFVCYAEAQGEYAGLATDCSSADAIGKLGTERRNQCLAYQALLTSSGNSNLLTIWQDDQVFSAAQRRALLDGLIAAVPGSTSACDAVSQLLPAYDHAQVQQLAKWDGIIANGAQVDADASRIDRFYHRVTTIDGSARTVDDDVHAPVKIPVLGNLVPNPETAIATQDFRGAFLGSGVVSSLQHYVRLHAALVGSDGSGADDNALVPLMNFLAGLKLPTPAVAASVLNSPAYARGKALFTEKGCAGCHDTSSTLDQPLVPYTSTVRTDFTYALMLDPARSGSIAAGIAALTPADVWNAPQGQLKPPHLQGLWTYQAFLHNGMSHSLQNLFCRTGDRKTRVAVYPSGDRKGEPIHEAPFLDSGHTQTCGDLTDGQRDDLITYLMTL